MSVQRRGEETRTRILDAALDCFGRYGYDASAVSEICRRAGVTKGGFYHHFPSKQALFLEMLERWLNQIDAGLEDARSGAETIPDEFLSMTAMVRSVFRDADGKLPIFMEFLTAAGRSPTVWQATVVPFRKYRAFFAQMFRDGMEEGSLRQVDPNLATRVLMSFAIGTLAQGLLDPHGADWGQVAEGGMRLFLEGVAQDNADKKEGGASHT